MNTPQFTLTHAAHLGDTKLALTYADEHTFELDMEPLARKFKALKPLLRSETCRTAEIVRAGKALRWNNDDNLELAADNLRARAIEQSGQYSHEFLWEWMHQHRFTLDAAAKALGLSRRMVAYYRSGEKPLPTTVALACFGYDSLVLKAA